MKTRRIFRTCLWLILAVALQGCGIAPAPTQAPQSISPEMLGTIVAETAVAAQTQTARFLPTPTSTATPTRTPSRTPTPATPTPTFFFALPTFTPTITETPIPPTFPQGRPGTQAVVAATEEARDAGFTGLAWSCGIQERTRPTIRPKERFSIFVTLRNTGTKSWGINTVDFVYTGGYRHEGTRIDDLPANVASGNTITLRVDFKAPKEPKTYNSLWALKVGNNAFCGVKLSFQVIEK